jgi:uncharacterized protein YjbI with pentapeptide repeats
MVIRQTTEVFEPPKYIASLIAAVNDGAKSAQTGAFLFLAVGLYLLATAFSATDEDLLLGKTVTISQIGASCQQSFSFAIAPLVFVFLHIYALVRYDLLAANVRHFVQELRDKVMPESDRERCRQLLANVEFIVALTAPHGSTLYSRAWPWLFCGIVAVFPVTVLLLVQINALRYQSDMIVSVQRATLMLDLVALVLFFRRNALDGSAWPERRAAKVRRWARLLVAPVFIVAVNGVYLSTVPADADAKLVRYNLTDPANPHRLSAYAVGNPLDLLSCPGLNWGCRFLRVDHRTLIDKAWDEKAVGVLRMKISELMDTEEGGDARQKANAERARAMAAIEGVFLRNRSLRFAVLNESRLYAADLIEADLRSATLTEADIFSARLGLADLRNANLVGANLSGANLIGAKLKAATLTNANLSGATLSAAHLDGANLGFAALMGANLMGAHLDGANLMGARLDGANLSGAHLDGANLASAKLDSQDQLNQACGKPKALPDGLKLDKPCPTR